MFTAAHEYYSTHHPSLPRGHEPADGAVPPAQIHPIQSLPSIVDEMRVLETDP